MLSEYRSQLEISWEMSLKNDVSGSLILEENQHKGFVMLQFVRGIYKEGAGLFLGLFIKHKDDE